MSQTNVSPRRARAKAARKAALPGWAKPFLPELAATSNVSAAARHAKICTATAYDARRANAEFNRRWQQALCEGYENLKMELLRRLRDGEVKLAPGARRGMRQYDNATAFRLLAAHRDSAARQQAIRGNADAATIILSINAKLDLMRERKLSALQGPEDAGDRNAGE